MIRIIVAALLLLSGPALAEECKQEDAVYTDGKDYALTFKGTEYATSPYLLQLKSQTTDEAFGGDIVYGNGISVPYVRFGVSCSEGEFNLQCDEDVYEGVAYTIGNYEAWAELPGIGEPAAKAILLPEAVIAFYNRYKLGKLDAIPMELFRLTGCQ